MKYVREILSLVDFLRGNALFLGIDNGKFAFSGPHTVWIDLTNRCNLHCICCWNYSPLLEKSKKPAQWFRDELKPALVSKLLKDLEGMGTREIFLSGGGDPLMYPFLGEVVSRAATHGMRVTLLTNLTPPDEKQLSVLEGAAIHRLVVNLWAASEEVYRTVHPHSRRGDFTRALTHVRELASSRAGCPDRELILNNILLKYNVREFNAMAAMAYETGASNVWYATMDLADELMRPLLMDADDISWLLAEIERARINFYFDRRQGWHFNAAQLEELYTRLSNSGAADGIYHSDYIDNIPCYAGWTVARVTADGNVCPCCKADRMPLGNIHTHSFREIWHSRVYNTFRHNAKQMSKRDDYFRVISCERVCDNWGFNEHYHAAVNHFHEELNEKKPAGGRLLQRLISTLGRWIPGNPLFRVR